MTGNCETNKHTMKRLTSALSLRLVLRGFIWKEGALGTLERVAWSSSTLEIVRKLKNDEPLPRRLFATCNKLRGIFDEQVRVLFGVGASQSNGDVTRQLASSGMVTASSQTSVWFDEKL